jgi:hypothetical protein
MESNMKGTLWDQGMGGAAAAGAIEALSKIPLAYRALRNMKPGRILERLGLQRRRSRVLLGAGMLGVGLVVGVGATLLLAPSSGRMTRHQIKQRLNRSEAGLKQSAERARGAIHDVKESAKSRFRSLGNGSPQSKPS